MRVTQNKRRWLAGVLALALMLGAGSLGTGASAAAAPPPSPGAALQAATLQAAVQAMVADMTIEEKVGQMFVPYAYGPTLRDETPANVNGNRAYAGVDNIAEMIETYHLGGIILYGWARNIVNHNQLATLNNDMQEVALAQRLPIPLLLGIDAESAAIGQAPATVFPGTMAIGATHDPGLAYAAARVIGRELKAMGIHQNYAPVADVNINPANPVIGLRSFGSDPDHVAAMTVAQTLGYQAEAVAATAKHFPGHGDTDVDSHVGLPVINHTLEELWEIDLPPFQAAIDAGLDSIMTAHIVVPAVDPTGRPATLSKPILTGLLREQMGFDGVIITDALNMQGVRDMFGDDRVVVEAVLAGVDLLLFPIDMKGQYKAVLDAVASGEITEERLDESVFRILLLKIQRGIFAQPFVDLSAVDAVIGAPGHKETLAEVAAPSVTLVKNDHRALPLGDVSGKKILVAGAGAGPVGGLSTALTADGATIQQLQTGTNPNATVIANAVTAAGGNDVVIVITSNANAAQANLVQALRGTGKPVVTVGVARPYDINTYPDAETHLVTYGSRPETLQALANVLTGSYNP